MSVEPFTAFAFAVELRLPGSDAPLCEAAFCACDGLELRREIIRARDGADPASVRLLPGAESFGNVILRRGMTSSFDLWDWWGRVRRGQAARATCDIVVLSPDLAQERVRFRLHRCLPAKITGPALNAAGNDIAIEVARARLRGDRHRPPGRQAARRGRQGPRRPGPAARARRELRARDQQGALGHGADQPARAADVVQSRARPDDAPGPATGLRRRRAPGPRAVAPPTTCAA